MKPETVAEYEAAHPVACAACRDSRLKLGGWMGPTPIRRYPDPCPDCSPELAGRDLQSAYVAYVTEPGRFDAEGQARMLLEPKPEPMQHVRPGVVLTTQFDSLPSSVLADADAVLLDNGDGTFSLKKHRDGWLRQFSSWEAVPDELKAPPATTEHVHGVYCSRCDWRTTWIVLEGRQLAACDSCRTVHELPGHLR